MTVHIARITREPIDLDAHLNAVSGARAGSEILFVGRVRNHDEDAGGQVIALEYSAHPDAEKTLLRLAEEAVGDTDAEVAVSHRIGRLTVGDAAVVIAVSSAHRGESYEVSRMLIETIKHSLPIWKRQVEADGTTAWKGLGG